MPVVSARAAEGRETFVAFTVLTRKKYLVSVASEAMVPVLTVPATATAVQGPLAFSARGVERGNAVIVPRILSKPAVRDTFLIGRKLR